MSSDPQATIRKRPDRFQLKVVLLVVAILIILTALLHFTLRLQPGPPPVDSTPLTASEPEESVPSDDLAIELLEEAAPLTVTQSPQWQALGNLSLLGSDAETYELPASIDKVTFVVLGCKACGGYFSQQIKILDELVASDPDLYAAYALYLPIAPFSTQEYFEEDKTFGSARTWFFAQLPHEQHVTFLYGENTEAMEIIQPQGFPVNGIFTPEGVYKRVPGATINNLDEVLSSLGYQVDESVTAADPTTVVTDPQPPLGDGDPTATTLTCSQQTTPWIDINSVNSGQPASHGQSVTIAWSTCNMPEVYDELRVFTFGSPHVVLGSVPPAANSLTFIVPSYLEAGTYDIRVGSKSFVDQATASLIIQE